MPRGRAGRSSRVGIVVALAVAGACRGGAPPASRPAPEQAARDPSRSATAEDWKGTTPARLEELFIGRFPGVRVVATPGGISVRIRGQTSINGSNAPLYILDGLPYDAPNGLISINPQDVERIEILKDVGETAYYGVRGANGVVLITTKRGGR